MARTMFESNHFLWGVMFSKNLIKAKLKTKKDTVFAIVQFSKQARTVLGFTDDIEKLFNTLESIKLDPQEKRNIENGLYWWARHLETLHWSDRIDLVDLLNSSIADLKYVDKRKEEKRQLLLDWLIRYQESLTLFARGKLRITEIKTNLTNALEEAIELILKDISKEMIIVPRIVIISDVYCTSSSSKYLEVAKNLNIKIDTIRIGKLPVNRYFRRKYFRRKNDLELISNTTDGRFFRINDTESLKNTELIIAKPNIKSFRTDLAANLKNPKFLREIAVDLRRGQELTRDQAQWTKEIRGYADFQKCLICFSETDSISKASFFLTGRYCPNCNAPFHVYCLALWVESQKNKNLKVARTFKCPHCFYLLKIPHEVIQMLNLKQLSDHNISRKVISQRLITGQAELTNISNLGDKALHDSCSLCNYIFEDNQKLVQCVCGTIYHFDCFRKLRNGQCRDCGVKLKL